MHICLVRVTFHNAFFSLVDNLAGYEGADGVHGFPRRNADHYSASARRLATSPVRDARTRSHAR
jgi:hypothetical protein